MKQKRGLKQVLLGLLITAVVGLVYFYFELPAINLHAEEFYGFAFMLAAVYCVSQVLLSGAFRIQEFVQGEDQLGNTAKHFFSAIWHSCKFPAVICVALVGIYAVGSFLSSEILRAGAYRDLLTVESGTFAEDVEELPFNMIPLLDKASAEKLGDRKLGELSDMVSQFEVANDYTQINYKDRPVRVTPLEYGDLIKWFNNRSKGLPAYIITDMVDQSVEVVRLEEGMKYSPSELFGRKLQRHLRFSYPLYMFDDPVFEIDEEGTPYWVCPRIVKTIGMFGGTDVKGAVLMNAVTGESEYYEEVPGWVDRLYSADLIVQQYDYHGVYVNGFINSILGQKDVTVTTEGYNYIAQNDDVYMYTGITSVGGDQSNIGFILTNQRTKETTFYSIAGADEYSAMDSAEGVVQHLGYDATFPLLLNIHGEPTYFMSLKDAAGLVKMYAMVNVRQYQVVATGSTVAETSSAYARLLLQNSITTEEEVTGTEASGVVNDIRTAVMGGESYFYIRLEGENHYYVIAAKEAPEVVVLNVGDQVKLTYDNSVEGLLVTGLTLSIQ